MIFRLPRLTPGYIRYLQTQAVQNVTHKAGDLVMPRLAMLLGALGIGMSGYSSRQLALHHHPSSRVLQWMNAPPSVGTFAPSGRGPQPSVSLARPPSLMPDSEISSSSKVP